MTFSEFLRYAADFLGACAFVAGIMGFWGMRRDYIRSDKKVMPWLADVEVLKSRGVTPRWFTKWSIEALTCFILLTVGLIRLLNHIERLAQ